MKRGEEVNYVSIVQGKGIDRIKVVMKFNKI